MGVAFAVPALFFFRFGRLDAFGIGLTAFLLLLVLAIEFIPRLNEKYGRETAAIKVERGRFDGLGVIWLLAILFAPLTVWGISQLTPLTPENWRVVLGAQVCIGLVLPCICVLPLIRYVRGPAAAYAILILFVGTAFPASFTVPQSLDLFKGAQWEQVTITDIDRYQFARRQGTVQTNTLDVRLSDGRTLIADRDRVRLTTGDAELLLLSNMRMVLAVRLPSSEGALTRD